MTTRQRSFSILIGVVGAIGSFISLALFLLKMRRNGLNISDRNAAQALYETVGAAYSGGFVAGFSLCFFLTLLAVAIGTWFESRRDAAARRTESVRIPLVEKAPRG